MPSSSNPQCFNCGAVLWPGEGLVRCVYCGVSQQVHGAPPTSPPTWHRDVTNFVVFHALGGVVLLLLGMSVWALLAKRDDSSSSPAMADSLTSWNGMAGSTLCLVDADGDGQADVVGWVRGFTAVSGATGRVLWHHESSEVPKKMLVCDIATRAVLVADDNDLTVTSLDPRSGSPRWSVKLPDRLVRVGFDPSCMVIGATNGAQTTVDASTGKPTPCAASPRPPLSLQPPTSVRVKGLEVSLRAKGPGTPKLVVEARNGNATAWTTTLPDIVGGMTPGERGEGVIVAQDDTVYLAGPKHGGPGIVVTALDGLTGKVVARHEDPQVTQNQPIFMRAAVYSGIVFVQSFGMLQAYDARTLERKWFAGRWWADHR